MVTLTQNFTNITLPGYKWGKITECLWEKIFVWDLGEQRERERADDNDEQTLSDIDEMGSWGQQ